MNRSREDKLKAIDYFMKTHLHDCYPLLIKTKTLVKAFHLVDMNGRFPDFSDIWGAPTGALDDIPMTELKDLLKEYSNGEYKGEHYVYLKIGEQYVYFNKSQEIRLSRRNNAMMNYEEYTRLPFDVELAIKSGIITVEEVWE